jgi:hypothetical protein
VQARPFAALPAGMSVEQRVRRSVAADG